MFLILALILTPTVGKNLWSPFLKWSNHRLIFCLQEIEQLNTSCPLCAEVDFWELLFKWGGELWTMTANSIQWIIEWNLKMARLYVTTVAVRNWNPKLLENFRMGGRSQSGYQLIYEYSAGKAGRTLRDDKSRFKKTKV